MSRQATLAFHGLSCNKGGRPLFKGVHGALQSGRWLHVTGANGAGKTSLLRILCGLSPAASGEILWNGQSIHAQRESYRRDLIYLGHANALQESLTVHENLVFGAALAGQALDPARIPPLLARFGIAGRGPQLVRQLSQGQRRRVALARLGLTPARLWVLDEPFVAMDEAGIALLCGLIGEHLAGGGLTVLTSHQPVAIAGVPAQLLELAA